MNCSLFQIAGRFFFASVVVALTACGSGASAGGDASDYAPAAGSGGEALQLDFTGETTVRGSGATPSPIDIGVGKAEALVHPDCTRSVDGQETCDDGRRPVPVDVTATCDDGACSVEVHPTSEGATLRIQPLAPGAEAVRVHATRRGGGGAWDDTVVIHLEVKKAATAGG